MVAIPLIPICKITDCLNPQGLFLKAVGSEVESKTFHINSLKFAVTTLQYINQST